MTDTIISAAGIVAALGGSIAALTGLIETFWHWKEVSVGHTVRGSVGGAAAGRDITNSQINTDSLQAAENLAREDYKRLVKDVEFLKSALSEKQKNVKSEYDLQSNEIKDKLHLYEALIKQLGATDTFLKSR